MKSRAGLLSLLALAGCTGSGAPEEAGSNRTCALEASYAFGWVGGLARTSDRSALEPPDAYRLTRSFLFEGEARSCTATLPACGEPDAVDIGDLLEVLDHPDVAEAWAVDDTVVWGRDLRPMDGAVWVLQKEPGSDAEDAIIVGTCDPGPDCGEIPEGLRELRELMEALAVEMAATPACEGIGPG